MKSLWALALAKDNESESFSQDAQNITWHGDKHMLTLCLADGASQSFFPKKWAELLVEHFGKNPNITSANWQTWLVPIQKQWKEWVENEVNILLNNNHHTSIENENALNRGVPATASFVGVSIQQNGMNGLTLRVVTVGDCCLLIANEQGNFVSLPYGNSTQFNDTPDFFASSPDQNIYSPIIHIIDIKDNAQTYFLLVSDAIAECLLIEQEAGLHEIFQQAKILYTQDKFSFQAFIRAKLQNKNLKNDDITIVGYVYPPFPAQDFDDFSLPAIVSPIAKIPENEVLALSEEGVTIESPINVVSEPGLLAPVSNPPIDMERRSPQQPMILVVTWLKANQAVAVTVLVLIIAVSTLLSPPTVPHKTTEHIPSQPTIAPPLLPKPSLVETIILTKGTIVYKDAEYKLPMLRLESEDTIGNLKYPNFDKILYVSKGAKFVTVVKNGVTVKKKVYLRNTPSFSDTGNRYMYTIGNTILFQYETVPLIEYNQKTCYKIFVKGFIKPEK